MLALRVTAPPFLSSVVRSAEWGGILHGVGKRTESPSFYLGTWESTPVVTIEEEKARGQGAGDQSGSDVLINSNPAWDIQQVSVSKTTKPRGRDMVL